MIEVRQRPYDGRRHPFETVDLGFGEGIRLPAKVPEPGSVATEVKEIDEENSSDPSEDCSTSDGKAKEGRKKKAVNDAVRISLCKKAKIDESLVSSSSTTVEVSNGKDEVTTNADAGPLVDAEESRIALEAQELRQAIYLKRMSCKYVVPIMPVKEMLIGRPLSTMKGHTAFLTFAVRPPFIDLAAVI